MQNPIETLSSDISISAHRAGYNFKMIATPEKVTPKWVRETIAAIESDGFDSLMILRSRYIRQARRGVMSIRSGTIHTVTTYAKANGWKAKVTREDNTYY